MTASIVIYGPQGCGKTLNGDKLARYFGLQRVVDDGLDLGGHVRVPASGALVLTNDPEELRRRAPAGVRFIAFAQACRMAGIRNPIPRR
ncbi:MAG TPA: hypothetical protein VEB23_08270 [Ramlibacter sp.]|nr:hypothetical protein [Ramlibacter sp.]